MYQSQGYNKIIPFMCLILHRVSTKRIPLIRIFTLSVILSLSVKMSTRAYGTDQTAAGLGVPRGCHPKKNSLGLSNTQPTLYTHTHLGAVLVLCTTFYFFCSLVLYIVHVHVPVFHTHAYMYCTCTLTIVTTYIHVHVHILCTTFYFFQLYIHVHVHWLLWPHTCTCTL